MCVHTNKSVVNIGVIYQRVYKPGSVRSAKDKARRPFIWDALKRPTRATVLKHTIMPPLFGLAPDGVYHARFVTKTAVRSYHTLSPLPRQPKSVGRFAFCCTFPKHIVANAPAGRYPASCFNGARTFLPPSLKLWRGKPARALTKVGGRPTL